MSQLLYNVHALQQDAMYTSLGLPTPEKIILGIIVFIGVILVWVGASILLSQLISPTNEGQNFISGGITATVGLGMMLGVNIYRSW